MTFFSIPSIKCIYEVPQHVARVALSTRGTAVNKTHQMSAFLEGPFSCVETDTTKSIKQINRKSFQTGKKKVVGRK